MGQVGFWGPPMSEAGNVKGKRFRDEQIRYALRQAEGGTPVADGCRQMGERRRVFKYGSKGMASSACGTSGNRRSCVTRMRGASAKWLT